MPDTTAPVHPTLHNTKYITLYIIILTSLFVDCLGAEFWVQVRSGKTNEGGSEGGLEFHFDKDETLLVSQNTWRHPVLSTVWIKTDNILDIY